MGDGVVAKVEVFEVNAMAGLLYGFEKVVKLFLSVLEEHNTVVVRKPNVVVLL
jgi:hypothetical protein